MSHESIWTSFLCKVKVTLLPNRFFPANFSFVFWKREFWREKIYLAKEWIYIENKVFPIHIIRFVTKPFENIGICRVLSYKGGGGSKILENCVTDYMDPLFQFSRSKLFAFLRRHKVSQIKPVRFFYMKGTPFYHIFILFRVQLTILDQAIE